MWLCETRVLEVSQIEEDSSLAYGQSCQGLALIFQFRIQLQKDSLPQQRNISITCKKYCVFPPSNSKPPLCSPYYTIIQVFWGMCSGRIHADCTPWHFHVQYQILQAVQDSYCRAVLCLVRTYFLLVLSEFAVALVQENSVCLSIEKGMSSNLVVFLPLKLIFWK